MSQGIIILYQFIKALSPVFLVNIFFLKKFFTMKNVISSSDCFSHFRPPLFHLNFHPFFLRQGPFPWLIQGLGWSCFSTWDSSQHKCTGSFRLYWILADPHWIGILSVQQMSLFWDRIVLKKKKKRTFLFQGHISHSWLHITIPK